MARWWLSSVLFVSRMLFRLHFFSELRRSDYTTPGSYFEREKGALAQPNRVVYLAESKEGRAADNHTKIKVSLSELS